MDVFNDALTLLHQYRYVEAYELVEKMDADPQAKIHYLIEIARKQKQHLVKSLPQPFTEIPANLAEWPVRFWLWFPYMLTLTGFMMGVISINSGNLSMFICGLATFLTLGGWLIGGVIARNQIQRYETRNMERLLKSVHAMLRVYQHLIEQDYRAAREVLESGDVMPNVARAWLRWLNNVHQAERQKAGIKIEVPPQKTETNGYHLWLAALLYLMPFMRGSEDIHTSMVAVFIGSVFVWVIFWIMHRNRIAFLLDSVGLFAFSITISVLSSIISMTLYNARQMLVTPDEINTYVLVFFTFLLFSPFVIFSAGIFMKENAENLIHRLFWPPYDEKVKSS